MRSKISNLRCFRSLPDNALDQIASRARLQELLPGTILINELDRGMECFIVLDGRLAVSKTSTAGNDLTVDLLYSGDFFGLGMALAWEASPVMISAQVKSRIVWISKFVITELVELYPHFAQDLLGDVFRRLERSYDASKSLAHDNSLSKVAHSLLVLAERFQESDCGCGYLSVCMTREQLSHYIGCARETVTRVIQDLSRRKIIDLSSRGRIKILDLNALKQCCGLGNGFNQVVEH